MNKILLVISILALVFKLNGQNIYSGGNADGFSYASYSDADNPALAIFSGNSYDGFSSSNYEQADNPATFVYAGGNADGFAWLNYEQADNPVTFVYSGGNADGFAWLNYEEVDNPATFVFSGGNADGFAWRDYEEPDNLAVMIFSGGQADGFAWQDYNVSFYWEGDDLVTPNDWFTPENWSANAVPTTNDDIEIPVVASNQYPEISGVAESRSVIIYSGASTIINTDGSYTVAGGFVNNGNFTMLADAIGTASFIDNGSISGTGTNTIKSFLSGNNYHYVSSPIQCPSENPLSNATSDLFTVGCSGFNANFYSYDETYDLDGNPATSPVGAFDPDNLVPGWTFAHGGAGNPMDMTKKTGYAHFDYCDKTVDFVGVQNTGTVNYENLSYTNNDPMPGPLPDYYDGWHLVSNPYPSSIDWDAVSASPGNLNNIDNAIYVWKGDAVTGAYEEYVNGISGGTGLLDRYISPEQAFFIHTTANNASFQLNNSFRVHSSAVFLKNKKQNQFKNLLKIQILKNGLINNTTIYFTDSSTTEFDGKTDAFKLFGAYSQVPQIYSITPVEQIKLGINAMPADSLYNINIPLGIRSVDGGISEISITDFIGFDKTQIYLEDLLLDSLQNLRILPIYNFNLSAGDISDRFILHFLRNNVPLLIDSIKNTNVFEDSLLNFSVKNNFLEIDLGDSLVLTAMQENGEALPDWLIFNSQKKEFVGVPLNEDVGTLNIKVIATDMLSQSNSQVFSLNIYNTNDKPIVLNHIQNQIAIVGNYFEYRIPENTFFDEDVDDSLTLSAVINSGLPTWLNYISDEKLLFGIPQSDENCNVNVKATDLSGATICDDFSVFVNDNSTNISEEQFNILISPNPVTKIVKIESSSLQIYAIDLLDASGKSIYQTNNCKINMLKYNSGVYFLRIYTDNGIFIEKIIKSD